MEREIYLERKQFELKFQPKRPVSGLLPLEQPGLFLSNESKIHSYPVGYQNKIINDTVSIECDVLFTNRFHDGIWLFVDDTNDSVRIPGGCIKEEDWGFTNQGAYYVIYKTLVKSLIQIHPIVYQRSICDPMMNMMMDDYSSLGTIKDLLNYIITQHGFKLHDPNLDPVFFYQYYLREGGKSMGPVRPLDRIRIYAWIEVDEPMSKVPSLVTCMNTNQYVWYSRADHKISRSYRGSKEALFHTSYKTDIRVSESGFDILENIFQTKPLFGNLDIY